jgi:hypothetical protein
MTFQQLYMTVTSWSAVGDSNRSHNSYQHAIRPSKGDMLTTHQSTESSINICYSIHATMYDAGECRPFNKPIHASAKQWKTSFSLQFWLSFWLKTQFQLCHQKSDPRVLAGYPTTGQMVLSAAGVSLSNGSHHSNHAIRASNRRCHSNHSSTWVPTNIHYSNYASFCGSGGQKLERIKRRKTSFNYVNKCNLLKFLEEEACLASISAPQDHQLPGMIGEPPATCCVPVIQPKDPARLVWLLFGTYIEPNDGGFGSQLSMT